MGVRLVQYNRNNNNGDGSLNRDHDELINRDLLNQHPIYAITGLQEVLNILEDSIQETNTRLNQEVERINSDIESINKEIEKIIDIINNLNVIKDVEDTYSVDMSYDKTTKILKADVKVYKDTKNDSNSIQVLADGLYVPKTMTEDSNTITWSVKSLGETLKEIYQNGIKFSHYPNSWSNVYSSSEANAWYWDDNLQSFVQPRNTNCFTGFVTQNFYDYYTHTVTLRSTDSLETGHFSLHHPETATLHPADSPETVLPPETALRSDQALEAVLHSAPLKPPRHHGVPALSAAAVPLPFPYWRISRQYQRNRHHHSPQQFRIGQKVC